ncbi:CarD family transcriptional regulator [Novosphingobium panipatense]|uniref:CarD family transcriptional regulator n=1 Tax=Novosphingobium panipatense TaxID=428991 RepID=UPI003620446C
MPVVRGFRFGTLLAVSATDLLGSRAHRKEAGSQRSEINPFLSGELARGDVVVHADHGICVVEGLEPSPEGGDALLLRFAAGAAACTCPSGGSHLALWRRRERRDARPARRFELAGAARGGRDRSSTDRSRSEPPRR